MAAEHRHDLRPFSHSHAFADDSVGGRERALTQVTLLTLVVMCIELAAGWWSGSLALLADGWHMGTHGAGAGGAVLAYRLSARAAGSEGYAFGGWKIEVLTAYTSGLMLLGAAIWIAVGRDRRAAHTARHRLPRGDVRRVLGLAVNLASAWLLGRRWRARAWPPWPQVTMATPNTATAIHDHDHHDPHDHGHHGHHDHNFRAAYLHVIADAFTSVLAIAALAGGLWFGWSWLDPVVALLGAASSAQWSLGVLRSSARALGWTATADGSIRERVRELLESDHDAKVADLHVWQVGAQAWSAAVSVVADHPLPAARVSPAAGRDRPAAPRDG